MLEHNTRIAFSKFHEVFDGPFNGSSEDLKLLIQDNFSITDTVFFETGHESIANIGAKQLIINLSSIFKGSSLTQDQIRLLLIEYWKKLLLL